MPRTGLGRARLAPRVDLVSHPLDFEYSVFKFQILGPDFEIDESGGSERDRGWGVVQYLACRATLQ